MAKLTTTKNRGPKAPQHDKSTGSARRGAVGSAGESLAPAFSERKSIEDLAAEQGIKPTRLEDILGKGADLWESNQELEQFVEDIYAHRHEDRELAKP